MSSAIESVLTESRVFPPAPDFVRQANVAGMDAYRAMCAEAERDFEGFWARHARAELLWKKPFTKTLDESNAPFYQWFNDGELNASYNCLDRHLATQPDMPKLMLLPYVPESGAWAQAFGNVIDRRGGCMKSFGRHARAQLVPGNAREDYLERAVGGKKRKELRRQRKRLGDTVINPIGVLSFDFGSFRLEPTAPIVFSAVNLRPPSPPPVGMTTARIASFNIENFFLTVPSAGRGADTATEFTRQRDKIVAALAGLNADVIGLIELEKAGGNAAAGSSSSEA